MATIKSKAKKNTKYTLKGMTYQDVEALAAAVDLVNDKQVVAEYMKDTKPGVVSQILNNLYDELLSVLK